MERKINKSKNSKNVDRTICDDKLCPFHGNLKTRGKIFKGIVIKKFHRRVVIEFDRYSYIRKYERYLKKKTRLHARLPSCLDNDVDVGDYVQIQECRPISKIIHFVVINKIRRENESNIG